MRTAWKVIGWAALVASGCATTAQPVVSHEQLRRLPKPEQQALRQRENAVRLAESNEATAVSARRDAARFRDVVGREFMAAQDRVRAARSRVQHAMTTPDPRLREEARRELRLGEAELRTVRAKRTYADELFNLRDAEVAGRHAEVALARARQELGELDKLRSYGEARYEDRGRYLRAEDRARTRVAERGREVAAHRAAAQAARSRWYARRSELDSIRAQAWPPAGMREPRPAPPE
jgi:hypothetical protein